MMTIKNRAICILGMHRSGTSAITRSINLLGVYLGKDDSMLPPIEDNNPKGFWEHKGIVDIHEKMLRVLNRTWHDIWPMEYGWCELPEIKVLKQNLVELIKYEFGEKPLWGWKDPRTCIMLPIWQEVFDDIDSEVNFIIVIRNPLDCAISLQKRDSLPLNEGYLLWQHYITSALFHTKDYPRIIVGYENFLRDWRYCINKITISLNLPNPNNDNNYIKQMETFLDKDLQHSHSSTEDVSKLVKNKVIPDSVMKTYELCNDAEENPGLLHSNEFIDTIDKITHEHNAYTRLISVDLKESLQSKEQSILKNISQNKKSESRIIQLESQISSKERQLRNRHDIIVERNKLIEDMNIQLEKKNQTIKRITNTWSWRITKPIRWLEDKIRASNNNKEESSK